MRKIVTMREIGTVQPKQLQEHLQKKTEEMFAEYGVDTMDSIGYYVLLEKDEYTQFPINRMEFVEVLHIGKEIYLHGVNVLSVDCAEDCYLQIEAVTA